MFADKLIRLRKSKGMSQQALADALKVGRSTIGMYELGSREPNFKQLNEIADLFGVSVSELIDEHDNELVVVERMKQREEAEELSKYLDMLRTRPEMKILLDTVEGATKEEVEANVKFLEALRGNK